MEQQPQAADGSAAAAGLPADRGPLPDADNPAFADSRLVFIITMVGGLLFIGASLYITL